MWLYGVIIAFQVALVVGAPWGRYTQGGLNEGSLPTGARVVAAASAFLIGCMLVTVLAAVGRGPMRSAPMRSRLWAMRATTAYAGVAVVANLATRSSAERAVWAPVSVVLLYLCVRVLQGMRVAH